MKIRLVGLIMLVALLSSPMPTYAADDWGDSDRLSSLLSWLKDYFDSRNDNDNSSNDENNSPNDDNDDAYAPSSPQIENTEPAAEYLAEQFSNDTGWEAENLMPYTRKLAETLSQLSPAAQRWVFNG